MISTFYIYHQDSELFKLNLSLSFVGYWQTYRAVLFQIKVVCVVILFVSTTENVSHAKPDIHCCNVSNELTYKFHFIAFSETQRFLRTTSLCMIKSSRE